MAYTFTAVYEKYGDWYIGYVEELPGGNSQEATLEQARESLKEAVQLVIEANRESVHRDADEKEATLSGIREKLEVTK